MWSSSSCCWAARENVLGMMHRWSRLGTTLSLNYRGSSTFPLVGIYLGVASGLLCVLGGPARAAVILPGGTFDVAISNDPSGGDFSQSGIPLSTSPTPIDNGLLTVSELIQPVNASTDWIQFTFS